MNLMFAVVSGLLKDFSIVYTVVPRAWTPKTIKPDPMQKLQVNSGPPFDTVGNP